MVYSTIWTVLKDTGAANNALPVIRELEKRGHSFEIFADEGSPAVGILQKQEIKHQVVNSAVDLMNQSSGRPDVYLLTMSSKGGVGRDLVPMMKTLVKDHRPMVVGLQDYWGARMGVEFKSPVFWPDYLCVNDSVSKEIAARVWPSGLCEVVPVGWPHLDDLKDMEVEKTSNAVRAHFGLTGKKVVAWFGQLQGSGLTFLEVVKALKQVDAEIYLVARNHPRMLVDGPEKDKAATQEALDLWGSERIITDSKAFSAEQISCAADLNVSMYSTVLNTSAALQKPTLSVMFAGLGTSFLAQETGGVLLQNPLVELRACEGVDRPQDLLPVINGMLKNGNPNSEVQAQAFRLDGRNASRVADLIESWM